MGSEHKEFGLCQGRGTAVCEPSETEALNTCCSFRGCAGVTPGEGDGDRSRPCSGLTQPIHCLTRECQTAPSPWELLQPKCRHRSFPYQLGWWAALYKPKTQQTSPRLWQTLWCSVLEQIFPLFTHSWKQGDEKQSGHRYWWGMSCSSRSPACGTGQATAGQRSCVLSQDLGSLPLLPYFHHHCQLFTHLQRNHRATALLEMKH